MSDAKREDPQDGVRRVIPGDSDSPPRGTRPVIQGESAHEVLEHIKRRAMVHKSDGQLLGSTTAEVMEEIERRYPDAEIGAVVVIAEVTTPEGDARVLTGTSDTKRHIVRGLIEVARDQMASA
jgi:hypothetical protein